MNLEKIFRMTGSLEGVSLLLLFFFAMPMKYVYGEPQFVRVIGSAHGFLFLAYVGLIFVVSDRENWSLSKKAWAFVLSSVPFGTWIFERRIWKS